MSEENEAIEDDVKDDGVDPTIALQEKLDAIIADNDRLKAKINESNKHTKAAEAKAASEEKERLRAANDFEQLYKSSELEREALTQEILAGKEKAARSEETKSAYELANDLTKDTRRAKLLAKELMARFKFTDDGIRITDSNGNLTVSTMADLKLEVQKNPDYDFLIDGVDSSGGSATGSNNGSGAAKVVSRAEFAALNPVEQMAFSKEMRSGKAEIT